MSGLQAAVNPFAFSTKYRDVETGLVYYGLRYYTSDQGRWLSRDPLDERAGVNLMCFLANDPMNSVDGLGAEEVPSVDAVAKEGALAAYAKTVEPIKNWKPAKVPPTELDKRGPNRDLLIEWAGLVCDLCEKGIVVKREHTQPQPGNAKKSWPLKAPCKKGWIIAGVFHSHVYPSGASDFDKALAHDDTVDGAKNVLKGLPSWIAEFGGWDGPPVMNKEKAPRLVNVP
jgi:RHS repeat-associated protein